MGCGDHRDDHPGRVSDRQVVRAQGRARPESQPEVRTRHHGCQARRADRWRRAELLPAHCRPRSRNTASTLRRRQGRF
ncbi:hypothetical protein Bcep18194_C7192 [Burkholderia lata]|uniref:Uncharacterized protein n=1 Tax=Burkholderia lata (strain ATCC 17760 / DSM 23089 / LMG 22485 / NCIMB 9086 / R18194 / 383) TaxID=482957 RepID=Q39MT0_BURL3|nr:hypothetical protein Bcep18194_C7192 [Burkholderia lata]